MNRADLVCRLIHPNVRAFLQVLRAAFDTVSPNGYSALPNGSHFAGGWNHPMAPVRLPGGPASTRAGAYMLMARTWETLQCRYGFMEYDPDSQDQAAVAVLEICGALEHVMAGDLKTALERASVEWPELDLDHPAAPMSLERAIEIYRMHNGLDRPAGTACERPPRERAAWRRILSGLAFGAAVLCSVWWLRRARKRRRVRDER